MAESKNIDVMSTIITLSEIENVIEDFNLRKDTCSDFVTPNIEGNKHYLTGEENGQEYDMFLEIGKDTYYNLYYRQKQAIIKAVIEGERHDFKQALQKLY
jgi:hypothetical protein